MCLPERIPLYTIFKDTPVLRFNYVSFVFLKVRRIVMFYQERLITTYGVRDFLVESPKTKLFPWLSNMLCNVRDKIDALEMQLF